MAGADRESNPRDDDITAETTDRDGARVVLLRRVWQSKVLVAHPEMTAYLKDALRSVARPDHVEEDPVVSARTRCYARKAGPSNWLVAVVSYEQEPARIISAFANRKDPPKWTG